MTNFEDLQIDATFMKISGVLHRGIHIAARVVMDPHDLEGGHGEMYKFSEVLILRLCVECSGTVGVVNAGLIFFIHVYCR
jgi:hypothetical protein